MKSLRASVTPKLPFQTALLIYLQQLITHRRPRETLTLLYKISLHTLQLIFGIESLQTLKNTIHRRLTHYTHPAIRHNLGQTANACHKHRH